MGGLAFDLWGVLILVEAASMYPSNSEGWQLCGGKGWALAAGVREDFWRRGLKDEEET